jgi:hypothetical protein
MPVIRIRYSYSLFIVHLIVSRYRYYSSVVLFVVQLFCFIFIWVLFWLLFKKMKRTILNLNSVQVFRSCNTSVPATVSTPSSRVNKHHTADSTDFVLVKEAKEPITIIEKRDRRNQYSPYINLSRGRDSNASSSNPQCTVQVCQKNYLGGGGAADKCREISLLE